MLKLSKPDKAFLALYAVARTKAFEAVADKAGFSASTETGLPWADRFVQHLRDNLDDLLIGDPATLKKQIDMIKKDADFLTFQDYCETRPRKNSKLKSKNPAMELLIGIVNRLFNYKQLSTAGIMGAYALVQKHKQRVCPYCQMHHVNYHLAATKADLKLRPPLDHFYPESRYPYLATSLFNLIPSCDQCNSRIKLAKDPLTAGLPHPFDASMPLAFKSDWRNLVPLSRISKTEHFKFAFDGDSKEAKEFAKFFKLAQRYQWHEVDLLDLALKYRRYKDLPAAFRTAVPPREYLLPFPAKAANGRVLGTLLTDVASRLAAL